MGDQPYTHADSDTTRLILKHRASINTIAHLEGPDHEPVLHLVPCCRGRDVAACAAVGRQTERLETRRVTHNLRPAFHPYP
jgi:hypothetical protein